MPGYTHKHAYRVMTNLLREARLRANFSQAEVAKAWGKTQSVQSKIERGERRLDLIQFIEYCEILGISPEDELSRLLAMLRAN